MMLQWFHFQPGGQYGNPEVCDARSSNVSLCQLKD